MSDDPALTTYEAFAPIYDEFNAANDYEMWLGVLLPELKRHGLRHGRLLDVGCGTGRAFAPMLRRGWQIHACDISPAMLARAESEAAGRVELSVADMRELPRLGSFELIICLNDAINYLLGDEDLDLALAAMARNLVPGGLLLFDCNSALTYASDYTADTWKAEHEGRRWTWSGRGELAEVPRVYEALIEGDGIEPICSRERHYPLEEVAVAIHGAGLRRLAVLGQQERDGKIVLTDPPEEDRDSKILYIAVAIDDEGEPASFPARGTA